MSIADWNNRKVVQEEYKEQMTAINMCRRPGKWSRGTPTRREVRPRQARLPLPLPRRLFVRRSFNRADHQRNTQWGRRPSMAVDSSYFGCTFELYLGLVRVKFAKCSRKAGELNVFKSYFRSTTHTKLHVKCHIMAEAEAETCKAANQLAPIAGSVSLQGLVLIHQKAK